MSDPLLSGADLWKTYTLGNRPVEVLRGVSVSVNRGDFLALRGASGAGKSTLLHLLGGLDTPNRGEVIVAGRNLAHIGASDLSRFRNEHIGFIFQGYYLLPEFDALENVCIPARMARRNASEIEKRGRDLLNRVGLGQRLEHRPYELSGGEQQRVAIARALINNPALIFADEPTGNLDSHTGEEIMDLLCSLQAEQNATLLVATHDENLAARAPRVIHLADGQILP
jgi:lipoprotein-releasing system ATP-binding protein